jgi:hypothetical protein
LKVELEAAVPSSQVVISSEEHSVAQHVQLPEELALDEEQWRSRNRPLATLHIFKDHDPLIQLAQDYKTKSVLHLGKVLQEDGERLCKVGGTNTCKKSTGNKAKKEEEQQVN